jgi:hypothetical protein
MNNAKKLKLAPPKIKLWGAKLRMMPEIKLTGDSAAKDGLRDRLQQLPKFTGR